MKPIILASASPRRRELLQQVKLPFVVQVAPDIERDWSGEHPVLYAKEQAHNKTFAIAKDHPDEVVLGADTVVIIDDLALGKPVDPDDATRMLQKLSGRTHLVTTAFCLFHQQQKYEEQVTSSVTFQALSAAHITGYLRSLEWQGKAGAYAIQGIAGAFVSRVEGSYSNVVGLPVFEVVAALERLRWIPSFPVGDE
jgi:septum formation protein